MISSSRASLILAAVLLVLTVGLGVHFARQGSGVTLTVQSTRGDAVRQSGGLLLPGTTVPAGETVRTHRGPLELRDGSGGLQVRLGPASRVQLAGSLTRPDGVHLRHGPHPGQGQAYTREGSIVHHWNRARVVQDHGRLAWRWHPPRLELTLGRDLRGHWKVPGGTLPLRQTSRVGWLTHRVDTFEGPVFPVREPPLAARRNTSLIPPENLMDRLVDHARKRGVPDRLPVVFGHWVRDRWGTVYLYLPEGRTMRVISAGPDKRFYTPDDRRWQRRPADAKPVR